MSTTDPDFTLTVRRDAEGYFIESYSHGIEAVMGEVRIPFLDTCPLDSQRAQTGAQAHQMAASFADRGRKAIVALGPEVEAEFAAEVYDTEGNLVIA